MAQPQPYTMSLPSSPAASLLSSSASCASLCSSRSTASDESSLASASSSSSASVLRANEHLAVLLPKVRWKPDSDTTHCDNFSCRMAFTLVDRRHHCRKCGGVFCGACSAQKTPLLDTSRLDFFHPPPGVPLEQLASPTAPLRPARVCSDCFAQIHGLRAPPPAPPPPAGRPPRRPASLLASPIAFFTSPAPSAPSSPSIVPRSASPAPSADLGPSLSRSASSLPRPHPHPRRAPLVRTASLPYPAAPPPPAAPEPSYGELDAYPLRRASALCKAAGGGRWAPADAPEDPGARVPVIGGRAPYELEMEREEAEERRRRECPVVRHGDFQYRVGMRAPREVVLERVPLPLATF